MIEELGHAQRLLAAESNMRETDDVEVLQHLAAAMKRLQQSVLVNFGAEPEEKKETARGQKRP